MAVPKKRTSSQRRDKRRANYRVRAPRLNTVPAVPQPAAAAPGLPDLRHLRRARGVISQEIPELPGAESEE